MALLTDRHAPTRDPPVVRWARSGYERLLRGIARRPRTVIAAALVFTVAGCSGLPFFGGSFIPELKEGHYTLHMSAVPGTSIEESMRIGIHVADALKRLPSVRSVAQRVGRAERAEDTWGTHYSEFEIDLKPLSGDETETAEAEIRSTLAAFVGVNFSLKTFLSERVEESSATISTFSIRRRGKSPSSSARYQAPPKFRSSLHPAYRSSPSACAKPTLSAGASVPSKCSS
jgi:Cu/Ag efflux pump CusA